jgi:hypothetical protein
MARNTRENDISGTGTDPVEDPGMRFFFCPDMFNRAQPPREDRQAPGILIL